MASEPRVLAAIAQSLRKLSNDFMRLAKHDVDGDMISSAKEEVSYSCSSFRSTVGLVKREDASLMPSAGYSARAEYQGLITNLQSSWTSWGKMLSAFESMVRSLEAPASWKGWFDLTVLRTLSLSLMQTALKRTGILFDMDVSDDDMYLKVTNSQYLENKYHKLIDDDNEELHEMGGIDLQAALPPALKAFQVESDTAWQARPRRI
ncbi:MAG: hypothetical protein SGPRY_001268 [Prymnesium sp.]